ncbi:MAG TPA: DUF3147 family protein [Patescibacteria group bacterium]|nr:DUF3147 family protein [Patescibacteria group bacterium]
MNELFIIKLILSFFVGGSYTILSTVAADKFGSKIGGIISGLPSTALFGLFFIGWTQTAQASAEATTLIPASLGISCLFVVTYIYFVKRSLWIALCVAIMVWGIGVYLLMASGITSFLISVLFFFVLYTVGYVFVSRIFSIPSANGKPIVYSTGLLVIRGLISGCIIGLSVIMAKVGGPVLGGLFATFPAMFTSTFLITYMTHGAAFSAAVAKSSLFALVSIVVFAIVARYAFVPFGIFWGSLIALLVSYLYAYFLYVFVVKKHK